MDIYTFVFSELAIITKPFGLSVSHCYCNISWWDASSKVGFSSRCATGATTEKAIMEALYAATRYIAREELVKECTLGRSAVFLADTREHGQLFFWYPDKIEWRYRCTIQRVIGMAGKPTRFGNPVLKYQRRHGKDSLTAGLAFEDALGHFKPNELREMGYKI